MARAERCPVCGGNGKVYVDKQGRLTVNAIDEKVCHGCGGKGWVEVSDR